MLNKRDNLAANELYLDIQRECKNICCLCLLPTMYNNNIVTIGIVIFNCHYTDCF